MIESVYCSFAQKLRLGLPLLEVGKFCKLSSDLLIEIS